MKETISKAVFVVHGFKNLIPKDAFRPLNEGAVLLDVRDQAYVAFKKFDIPEILYCPHVELNAFLKHLPRSRTLIVADSVGLFSKEAMKTLNDAGFINIINLAGGIVEWEKDGLPVICDKNERLSGSCVCQLRPRERG
ncbi:MAG: rhodanese-like domain-containing protein [Bacteroidales bacterium]|nr:rhodanese-like domain-containing protein [Bacteroidales bacterium]